MVVVPKVWVATKTRAAKGKKIGGARRFKPELCICNVTTACGVSAT